MDRRRMEIVATLRLRTIIFPSTSTIFQNCYQTNCFEMKTPEATFEQFFDTEACDSHYNIILLLFFFFKSSFSCTNTIFQKQGIQKVLQAAKRGKLPENREPSLHNLKRSSSQFFKHFLLRARNLSIKIGHIYYVKTGEELNLRVFYLLANQRILYFCVSCSLLVHI